MGILKPFFFGTAALLLFSTASNAWTDDGCPRGVQSVEVQRLIASVSQSVFRCAKYTQSDRQVMKPKSCDDTGGFGLIDGNAMSRPELKEIFGGVKEEELEKNLELRNKALETKFTLTSNMNAATFKFPNGATRTVFRGSYQAPEFFEGGIPKKKPFEKDKKVECMKDLVKDHHLSKIVNYDEIDWESAKRLTDAEKKLLQELNPKAEYWMYNDHHKKADGEPDTFQYKFKYGKDKVFDQVASIVNEIAGDPSKDGSAYIHCYGGHHRTGVVWGVLQKCMGQDQNNGRSKCDSEQVKIDRHEYECRHQLRDRIFQSNANDQPHQHECSQSCGRKNEQEFELKTDQGSQPAE